MQNTDWQVEMLGGLKALHREREPVTMSCKQTGTLFAYLALNIRRIHLRECLMALIWPEDGPEEASHKLRQSLYALRRHLGAGPAAEGRDVFLATRTTIQLAPSLFTTDVHQFEQALYASEQCGCPADKIRCLEDAVELCQGELLPGIYLDEFVAPRQRLAALHRSALQSLMHSYERMGDLPKAIESGQRSLALDPLMEEVHCDLMRLYAADGQPSAVIRQYQALASVLKRELNEEPLSATARLKELMRQRAQTTAVSHCDPPRKCLATVQQSTLPELQTGEAPLRVPHDTAPLPESTFSPGPW